MVEPFGDNGELVLTHFWHGTTVPPALVVRQFEQAPRDGKDVGPSVAAVGTGPRLYEVTEDFRRITLASPFDVDVILLNLTVSPNGVQVDQELELGSSWNWSFEYEVTKRDARYAVNEMLIIRAIGPTQVRVNGPPASGCD